MRKDGWIFMKLGGNVGSSVLQLPMKRLTLAGKIDRVIGRNVISDFSHRPQWRNVNPRKNTLLPTAKV